MYPAELEREVTLRDGSRLRLRPIRPEDATRLIDFYNHLSRETAYHRFFAVMKRLPPDWARMLASVDYRRRLALVAERGPAESPELVGVARYEPTDDPSTAEVAFVVADGLQGRGLGVILLHHLLAAGRARMLDLLARFTDVVRSSIESGVVTVHFMARAVPPLPLAQTAHG